MTKDDITKVKAQGFLLNRGTQKFNGRVIPEGCVFTAKQLAAVAECAEQFGDGRIAMTSRLTAEISGIDYEKIPAAQEYLAQKAGLTFGGTGAKIRPVAACKGTTCVFGNCDTQGIAREIYEKYYVGWGQVVLPHKFKIAVGGCPNSCMKPNLNDFGIEGRRRPNYEKDGCRSCKVCQVAQNCPMGAATLQDGKLVIDEGKCTSCGVCVGKCPFKAVAHESERRLMIYIGGTWGKRPRMGTPLPRLVAEEEVFPLVEKTLLGFTANAFLNERLGVALDRIGVEKAIAQILDSDELLERKDEILAAPVLTRK